MGGAERGEEAGEGCEGPWEEEDRKANCNHNTISVY